MQLKMQDILGFSSFYGAIRSQKLSMKTAYRLTQLARAIEEEMQFYRDKLQAIIEEFGEMDEEGRPILTEDGGGVKLRQGIERQCFDAMRELQEIEVTLPDIKFCLEDFGDVELSTAELMAILPFIEE